MNEKYLAKYFTNFDLTAFWRLFIDGNRQQTVGPLGFDEREPGYLKSLQYAFDFVVKSINAPLTVELLINLHEACTKFTKSKFKLITSDGMKYYYESFNSDIRDHVTSFGLVSSEPHKNFTLKGLEELTVEMRNGNKDYSITITERDGAGMERINSTTISAYKSTKELYEIITSPKNLTELCVNTKSQEIIRERLETILAHYRKFAEGKNNQNKSLAIATTIHLLELTHPFSDGNCRTNMLFLYLLLMREGLPLTILENPNRADLYESHEFQEEIENGYSRFEWFKTNKDSPVSGHENDKVFYLNETTTFLLVNDAVSKISQWSEINDSEKEKAFRSAQKILLGLKVDGLTRNELTKFIDTLTKEISNAIYKKSFYQVSLFSQKNTYGIHFECLINRGLNYVIFDEERLKKNFDTILENQDMISYKI